MSTILSRTIELNTNNFTDCTVTFGQASGGTNTDIEVSFGNGFSLNTNDYTWSQLASSPQIKTIVGVIHIALSNSEANVSAMSNAEVIDNYTSYSDNKYAIVSISGDATLLIG